MDALKASATAEGLKVTRGGRFCHMIGANQDKGVAVQIVADIFRDYFGERSTTIGVGDSENDLPMLERVDIPVLIPHPDGRHLAIRLPGLVRAEAPGSRGWNGTMARLLTALDVPSTEGS